MRNPTVDPTNRFVTVVAQTAMIGCIRATEKQAKSDEWKNEPNMIKMFRNDAKDYRKVLALAKAGKLREAKSLMCSLDTGAREVIPDSFWYLVNPE